VLRLAALAVAAALLTVATGAVAQERYRTPDEAVAALVDAVRSGELQQLTRVLGPGSDEIVRSGDPVDDAATRRRFLDAFEADHQIVPDGEDQALLTVGEERWPFPIRLVRLNNTWRFDAQLARSQFVYRRIGRNEASAINACVAYVAAQKEYAPRRVLQVRAFTHGALSADREKETVSTGRHRPVQTTAHSVNSPSLPKRKDIPSKASGKFPIRATTTGFSPGRGRTPRVAKSTIWWTATWSAGSR